MLKKVLRLFVFFIFLNGYAFQEKDSMVSYIVFKLKTNDLKKSLLTLNSGNDTLNNLFQYQYLFKIQGIKNDSLILKKNLENLFGKTGIIANYIYGDYIITKKTPNDSLAFFHYKLALKLSKKEKDTLLTNECLNRICDRLFSNAKDLILFKEYIEEYDKWKNDDFDKFWIHYYHIAYKLLCHLEIDKQKNTLDINKLGFEQGFLLASNSDYFLGLMHQLKGIYYDVFTDEYFKAKEEFKYAINSYEKTPYHYSQSCVYGNKVNLGIVLFNQNKTAESIEVFKDAMHEESNYYSKKSKMYISIWLNKAYKKLNMIDSAYVYSEMSAKLKDEIDKYNHSIAIKNIEEQSNVKEKEEEINVLEQHNNVLSKNLNTLIPFLGIIIFALICSFYLYKRYKKKSTILEDEQSETLQKLDELKNIVIKNHIVLKDKTKIYISDLLYIKAEDHYLNVVLNENKNHFVRGKLNQIKEELPPNFIQCHRSYIVNSNFIKQINSTSITLINKKNIPLSRSYKNKF